MQTISSEHFPGAVHGFARLNPLQGAIPRSLLRTPAVFFRLLPRSLLRGSLFETSVLMVNHLKCG
jgi:hypothetical protein